MTAINPLSVEASSALRPLMLHLAEAALSTARLIARDITAASEPLLSLEDNTTESSAAMVKFLPQIKAIAKEGLGRSRNKEALRYAYDLMLLLKTESYFAKGPPLPSVHRPSDEPADRLLAGIIRKRRERRHTWDWKGDLQVLECERALVWHQNKDAWYSATRMQLLSCESFY